MRKVRATTESVEGPRREEPRATATRATGSEALRIPLIGPFPPCRRERAHPRVPHRTFEIHFFVFSFFSLFFIFLHIFFFCRRFTHSSPSASATHTRWCKKSAHIRRGVIETAADVPNNKKQKHLKLSEHRECTCNARVTAQTVKKGR